MTKTINFLDKTIKNPERYKEIRIDINLETRLDMKYPKFASMLSSDFKMFLDRDDFNSYQGPVVFKIYTGLPRTELIPLKDLITSTLSNELIETKERFKTEKILGIMMFDDFDRIELSRMTLMDLLNYPLKKEEFNIELYDKKNRLYKTLTNWT